MHQCVGSSLATSVCFCNAVVRARCGPRSGSGGSLPPSSARVIAGLNLESPGARRFQSPPTQTTASLLSLCLSKSSASCRAILSCCSFVRPWLRVGQKTRTRCGPRVHTPRTAWHHWLVLCDIVGPDEGLVQDYSNSSCGVIGSFGSKHLELGSHLREPRLKVFQPAVRLLQQQSLM